MSSDSSKAAVVAAASPPSAPPDSAAAAMASRKDFASRHRVKKLLETYTMTADRSLLGPEASEEAFNNQHKYFNSSYSASSAYKLPPDVELSKTSPLSEKDNVSLSSEIRRSEMARVDLAASKRLQMQMAAVAAAGLKGGMPPGSPPPNGLATLSRIDGNGYSDAPPPSAPAASRGMVDNFAAAAAVAAAASAASSEHGGHHGRSRSRSSSDPRHLTGEMIRQMSVLQKKGVQVESFAASLANYQRQQLQMQAAYEKALKEKSYLKYNNHSSSTRGGGSATSSSTTTSAASAASAAPVFSTRDRGQANLSETRLANRNIACFEVGGEKRCCLPQILNSVLDQISLQAIHAACDELQIYCSTCTPEQLDVLKLATIIPNTASQCGLITKSDAERLCSRLLESNPPVASMMGFHAISSPFSFRVQHECFGKCRGIVLPEAYTSPNARCIECLECEGLFCPAKFVCHSHRNRENRTCHWGFDSANWRAYLHLADDYTEAEEDKLSKTVADFKSRYSAAKRKQQELYNGSRDRSSENKSPRGGHYEGSKRPRTDEHQMLSSSNDYGLLWYQTWAAAVTGGRKGQVNPATLAALSSGYAQAIKEGKALPPPPPGYSPGMPPPRPGSSSGHNGSYHRNYEAKLHSPHEPPPRYVKSSPLSEESSSERMSQPLAESSRGGSRELVSPGTPSGNHIRRPSKHSSSSLAEDILAIKTALDGASPSARERTLKTLERLTARLALAESERDIALDQLKKLQRRYEATEEELHKKRAELREALRNDAVGVGGVVISGNNGGSGHLSDRELEFTSKKFSASGTALPKMDMKSPARVIEEKSCESSQSSRSATPPISASALHAANQAAAAAAAVATKIVEDEAAESSPVSSEAAAVKLTSHLRRRSGTPASIRSRESEDLRDRMMTMEAELRALRDELSNRSSLASNTSSQATLKEDSPAAVAASTASGADTSEKAKKRNGENENHSEDNEKDEQPKEAKRAKVSDEQVKEDTSEDNDNEDKKSKAASSAVET